MSSHFRLRHSRSMNTFVDPATSAVHPDADAGRRQHAGKLAAAELAFLVGVENLRLAEPSHGELAPGVSGVV